MQGERLVYRMIIAFVMAFLVGLVGYASIRPRFQLRVDMPPEFLDASAAISPRKRAAEERAARAYWECVVTVIQRDYGYGQPLPPSPPSQFRITPDSTVSAKNDAARLRYWRRVRHVWYLDNIWTREQTLDSQWLAEATTSSLRRMQRYGEMLWARAETKPQ